MLAFWPSFYVVDLRGEVGLPPGAGTSGKLCPERSPPRPLPPGQLTPNIISQLSLQKTFMCDGAWFFALFCFVFERKL